MDTKIHEILIHEHDELNGVFAAREQEQTRYTDPRSSINLPFDERAIDRAHTLCAQYTKNKPDVIVIVAIGGSQLGSLAIHQACNGLLHNECAEKNNKPRVYFLDTLGEQNNNQIFELLERDLHNNKHVLFVFISKSGSTRETAVNSQRCCALLNSYKKDLSDHVVVVTDQNSPLHAWAEQQKISCLFIPKPVGGRFSVFSPVGLLPLGLIGLDIAALCAGARAGVCDALSSEDIRSLPVSSCAKAPEDTRPSPLTPAPKLERASVPVSARPQASPPLVLSLSKDTSGLRRAGAELVEACPEQGRRGCERKMCALHEALQIFQHYQDGYWGLDFFVGDPCLESVGKWYRQLIGESLGKTCITDPKKHCVLVPTVSVFTNDLHSVAQLYLGGLPKLYTQFLFVAGARPECPAKLAHPSIQICFANSLRASADGCIEGSSSLSPFYAAVTAAYRAQNKPFGELVLSQIAEYELGYLLQTLMLQVMYLAKLMDVNPFDQPHVELYKQNMRGRD